MRGIASNNTKYVIRNFIFVIIFIGFLALFYFCPKIAKAQDDNNLAQELTESVNQSLNDIDFSAIQDYFDENSALLFNIFGIKEYKQFISALISGKLLTDFNSVFSAIVGGIKQNLSTLLSPILLIFVIIMISVVFKNIRPRVAEDSVSQSIFFICYSLVVTIIAFLVGGAISTVTQTINNMQDQMNAIFPVVLTLMNTAGGAISVKAYTPLVLLFSNIISNIFIKVLLPIVIICFVLSIVGGISPKTKVKNLQEFFMSLFKWIVGIVFTIFVSFMTIQGITASSADGISIKTAKFAIKNYIPMLGGYISDGFEVARVGANLIKNAVGYSGIIILILTILSPIMLIAVLQLGLKFVAGLTEPLGDDFASSLIGSVSKCLSLMIVVILGIAIMYFLIMFLLICSLSGVAI